MAFLMQMKERAGEPCPLTIWSDLDAAHIVLAASPFFQALKVPSSLKSSGCGSPDPGRITTGIGMQPQSFPLISSHSYLL